MAKKSIKAKQIRQKKFSVRQNSRCKLCGRPRSIYRKFEICRLCFREMALRGEIPGITKSSW